MGANWGVTVKYIGTETLGEIAPRRSVVGRKEGLAKVDWGGEGGGTRKAETEES